MPLSSVAPTDSKSLFRSPSGPRATLASSARCLSVFVFSSLLTLPLAAAEPDKSSSSAQSPAAAGPATTAETLEAKFPYVIKVSSWESSDLRRGDKLKVISVRSDRKKIELGGTYWVQGTYTLSSDSTGSLLLTYPGTHNSGPQARCLLERGTGTFSLINTKLGPGDFFLSFYFLMKPTNANPQKRYQGVGAVTFN